MFDPLYPDIDEEDFKKQDWSDLYVYGTDTVPSNVPIPLGSDFMMRAYVDA